MIDVASLAEAWIEISEILSIWLPAPVASLAEAWIEIVNNNLSNAGIPVASLAEAWIEILKEPDSFQTKHVASLAEAWIEIIINCQLAIICFESPPSRRRGLKFVCGNSILEHLRRLPRGGVD